MEFKKKIFSFEPFRWNLPLLNIKELKKEIGLIIHKVFLNSIVF